MGKWVWISINITVLKNFMPFRKIFFASNNFYHIFTKSIAGYKVFYSDEDYRRMIQTLDFYTFEKPICKLSDYLENKEKNKIIEEKIQNKIIKIIAYVLMPTHFHLILMPLRDNIVSQYMNTTLKSYSKYFNFKYKRKGPLWESRFKAVLVTANEQLIHLTRYIHLNPVTAYLVNKPEEWQYSSYHEYIKVCNDGICDFSEYIDITPSYYKQFVNERIEYQRELAKIKDLLFE